MTRDESILDTLTLVSVLREPFIPKDFLRQKCGLKNKNRLEKSISNKF